LIHKPLPPKVEAPKPLPPDSLEVPSVDRKTGKVKRVRVNLKGMVEGLPDGEAAEMQAALAQRVHDISEQGLRILFGAAADAYRTASPEAQVAFLGEFSTLIDKHFPTALTN
jgi:capsular polysaccharide biosynthesis protein